MTRERSEHLDPQGHAAAAHSEIFSPHTGATECVDFATFERGWAFVDSGASWRAHFFVACRTDEPPLFGKHGRVKFYRALCGARSAMTGRTPFLEAGKALRCERCVRKEGKA